MNMFNGLNKQESSPAPKKAEVISMSVLDQGFNLGETVKFKDESGNIKEGKLMHEGVGSYGERIVGIEIEALALNLDGKPRMKNGVPEFASTIVLVPQDKFLEANSFEKRQELQDLAEGVGDLLN